MRLSGIRIKRFVIFAIFLALATAITATYFVITGIPSDIIITRISPKQPLDLDILDIETLDQKDEILLDYVRENHLYRPSKLPYNFPNGTDLGELIIVYVLPEYLKNKTGFFLEAGAFDGRTASFTLALELKYGWTGLLVECHPTLIPKVKSLNRKAYFADVCLSKSTHPSKGIMTSPKNSMPSSSLGNDSKLFPDFAQVFDKFEIQTIPLYSLLAAIGVKVVDFAVLDVQSFELDVLRNFPFDLIFVKMWLVEIELLSKSDKADLRNLMVSMGYKIIFFRFSSDPLFVHSSVWRS